MIVQGLIASYSAAVASNFNLNAVDFDGSTEFMANTSSSFSYGVSTIEVWLKADAIASGVDEDRFFTFKNVADQNIVFVEFYQSQWYAQCGIGGTGGIIQTGSPSINTIYHVVFSHNGTNSMKLYINGVDSGTATGVGALSATITKVALGAGIIAGAINSPFDGKIASLSYWDSQLSQTEITALYDSGNGYKNDKRNALGNYTSTANLKQQWAPGIDGTTVSTMGQSYVSSGGVNIGTNASNISSADIVTF